MNLLTIPLRNIKRKLMRTTSLTLVFTAGILSVVMLYYVSQSIGDSLEEKLTAFGANILIYPKTDTLNVSYGGMNLGDLSYDIQYLKSSEINSQIKAIELKDRISSIAPKLIEVTQINEQRAAVIGVVWNEELKIKNYWTVLNGTYSTEKNHVLVGSTVAEKLKLAPGDNFELNGNTFHVNGILEATGSEDDKLVFADLVYLQQAVNKPDQINFVEVSALCSGCPIDDIVSQIQKNLPNAQINALQNVVKQRMYTVGFVQKLVLGVSGIILVIASFMLSLFLLASVNERKKEIGILRSMGYSKSNIFSIFSFEAILIGLVSSITGFIIGLYASTRLLAVLEMGNSHTISFNIDHLLITVAAVSALSILAAAFPSMKAARIQPTEALLQL